MTNLSGHNARITCGQIHRLSFDDRSNLSNRHRNGETPIRPSGAFDVMCLDLSGNYSINQSQFDKVPGVIVLCLSR